MRSSISSLSKLTAAALLILPLAQASATDKRPISLDDLHALKRVSDPQISPDGAWVAYSVRSIDREKDKATSDVWMTSWDGSKTVQLTHSPASEHLARFSPDGQYLAFLSGRESEDEVEQIWLMNRAGGEATKLTDYQGGATDYVWSPDSKRLAVIVQDVDPQKHDDDDDKTDDKSTAKKKDKEKKAPKPIVIDRYYFKEDGAGYLTTRRQHLHIFDLATKKSESLTPGNHYEYLPAWSPDGTSIAFVSKRGGDFDRHDNHDLFVVEAKSGAPPRQLTTFPGSDCDPAWSSRPAWSPDGKTIAYIQGGDSKLIFYALHQLAVIPVAGGTARLLAAALDRSMVQPHWSPDGKSLYFLLEDDGNVHLTRIAAEGGEVTRMLAGRRATTTFDVGPDDKIAIVESTPTQPAEVYALDSSPRPLSKQNAPLTDQWQLGATEEIRFPSADGTEIHGLIVKPPNFEQGTKYPIVLRIHGGPVGQFENTFGFDWQLLAARGYLVVACNPRGSSGRGEAFQKAIYADWGNLDRDDVLAAVDYVVKQGLADSERLGVGGWSYGGMLTNYAIASDTRFKAAISGAAISNMWAGYGTDMYIREYEIELGTPWDNPEIFVRVSYPFLHANRIKTPTLFLCGEKDFNVPLLNSEQMYQALRSLGIDTQLVIYPEQGHDISRPSYQHDRLERYLGWFEKYLPKDAPKTR